MIIHFCLLVLTGLLVSLFVVSLGSSGGSVYVAVLSALFGLSAPTAASTALAAAFPSAAIGAWQYKRDGRVNARQAGRFLMVTIPVAIAFSLIAPAIPVRIYTWTIAIILIIVGILLLSKAFRLQRGKTQQAKQTDRPWLVRLLAGLGCGFMVGVGGMGGGEPVLAGLLLMKDKELDAVSTCSWTVFWTGIVGLAAHALSGSIDWTAVLPLVIGDTIGSFIAPHLAAKVAAHNQQKWLLAALGLLLFIMAVRTVF